ncbi:hypothetical protein L3X38_036086 [Prunus dulcis]|uniref:Uncharacterized protein n=1 Tax=Prunus dulcis TaxID=3755 RepID=A0AAD4V0T2_PRUDU|nr:hypothetical protein L3X38_036086 [Prunus dulcis]
MSRTGLQTPNPKPCPLNIGQGLPMAHDKPGRAPISPRARGPNDDPYLSISGGGYADRREKVARNIERWMRKTEKERKDREENGGVALENEDGGVACGDEDGDVKIGIKVSATHRCARVTV